MAQFDFDVAIIGAGIIGVSSALWAQMRGHRVVIIDPNSAGSGTSFGNACTMATYACMPVNDPSIFTSFPQLLFGKNSPVSISYKYMLQNPRWLLSFLANCTAGRSKKISNHLADLLAHSDAGLNPLISEAGAEDLIVSNGQLSFWSTNKAAKAAQGGVDRRRDFGVELQELTPQEALALEPAIKPQIKKAVFYPTSRHIKDPETLALRLHKRFEELGGKTISDQVLSLQHDAQGVAVKTSGGEIYARRAVVAAGAFSKQIAGSGAEGLPLGVERGYHLIFENMANIISRPVGWSEAGFYSVPMARGLRLAGTVEIANLGAKVNENRLKYIARRGAELFGPLPKPSSHWLGFRPSFPDALPAIGYSPETDRIIHAFGHQHLGLTLGGITGRITADLLEGRAPNINISAFNPDRRYIV